MLSHECNCFVHNGKADHCSFGALVVCFFCFEVFCWSNTREQEDYWYIPICSVVRDIVMDDFYSLKLICFFNSLALILIRFNKSKQFDSEELEIVVIIPCF